MSFVDASTGWVFGSTACLAAEYACPIFIEMTRDGGRTWQLGPAPDTRLVVYPSKSSSGVGHVLFANARDGWLYGPDLYATHDGGATWSQVGGLGVISKLAVSGTTLWMTAAPCWPSNSCPPLLYASRDLGHTWPPTAVRTPLDGSLFDLSLVAGRDVWIHSSVATQHTLLRTRDAGATWDERADPCAGLHPGPGALQRLATVDDERLWALCGGQGSGAGTDRWIFTSPDAAETWTLRSAGHQFGSNGDLVALSPERAFMARGAGGLSLTEDGGNSWQWAGPSRGTDHNTRRVAFADTRHGWAMELGIVWRTDDSGDTWQPVAP